MSDDKNPDDFDNLMVEQQDDNSEPETIGMAVGVRCKDSAEADERERVYFDRVMSTDLNEAILPIPFFDNGKCDPPTKEDAADLMKKFGITPEEYVELMELRS